MSPPPGYVAYGAQNQGGYGSFQNVRGIARTIGILIMILIPVQVISLIVFNSVRQKANDLLNGNLTDSEFKNSIGTSGVVSVVSSGLMLAIAVLTVIWMFRMAKNQRELGRAGTWGPGWAVGGWFVPPCVLYVVPYLMLRDLWKSSDPDSNPDWRSNRVGAIVHLWWVLFGLVPILFLTVTFSSFDLTSKTTDQRARDFDKSANITMLSNAVSIATAVVYLLLVRQLTARHAQTTNES